VLFSLGSIIIGVVRIRHTATPIIVFGQRRRVLSNTLPSRTLSGDRRNEAKMGARTQSVASRILGKTMRKGAQEDAYMSQNPIRVKFDSRAPPLDVLLLP